MMWLKKCGIKIVQLGDYLGVNPGCTTLWLYTLGQVTCSLWEFIFSLIGLMQGLKKLISVKDNSLAIVSTTEVLDIVIRFNSIMLFLGA